MNNAQIAELIAQTETPQIRAGNEHRFIDIWIVTVGERLFCRQYSFSKRSWYHAFQEDPSGAIRIGERVIPIQARIPDDLDEIQEQINQAYLDKHTKRFPDYPHFAEEMIGEKFMASTMELIPQEE